MDLRGALGYKRPVRYITSWNFMAERRFCIDTAAAASAESDP
jgi:hypothetical protein